ncbi:NYN domain-containing protein, partial [Vibrio parahaemolyticus]|nr:NYN domain-containing protein [Vibrio parahaemolyticus]
MGNRKIAVLIDSENTPHSKLNLIIEELSSFGQIIVKRAYGDFSAEQLKNWKQPLNELAIQAKQQFAYTSGKNSTDSLMIIDAMDLLYSQRFDAFALISSDSDFTSLATRLRESEIHVIGVGKAMTPTSFKNACDDFVAIENLNADVDLGEA